MPKKKIKKPKTRKEKFANVWKKPKVKKSCDDKSTNEQTDRAERATRDGLTKDRVALPERVIQSLTPIGTEKEGLWFTRKAIYRRVAAQGGYDPLKAPDSFGLVLQELVKEGYLQRAINPHDKVRSYIYRRTSKPYTVKIMGEKMIGGRVKIQKGFQLWVDHGKLPKWFRDMMH
jgi:hypothetical protein